MTDQRLTDADLDAILASPYADAWKHLRRLVAEVRTLRAALASSHRTIASRDDWQIAPGVHWRFMYPGEQLLDQEDR
ncbi:hypothetical protein ACQCX2_07745 [Propionibacteriaceae bacterium Y1700]|uniref:hypothetical protein n=1 Tax=Microlunatus sp. Y1700 TaxID=3418487 RepID=UPI003DA6EE9B